MPNPGLDLNTFLEQISTEISVHWLAGHDAAAKKLVCLDERQCEYMVAYFNQIHPDPIQIIGKSERLYLESLKPNSLHDTLERLFCPPCQLIVLVGEINQSLKTEMQAWAERKVIPLIQSDDDEKLVLERFRYFARQLLSQRTIMHGVFLEVSGIGVLLTGDAGIGKSELALELITRGHRLVADDAPEFSLLTPNILQGASPPLLQDFLEVRGLGVLNIRAMYGDNSVKRRKSLRLVVHLSHKVEHNRLATSYGHRRIMNIEIPECQIEVAPGRNMAVLIEAAVRNFLLDQHGYNATQDLIEKQHLLLKADSGNAE